MLVNPEMAETHRCASSREFNSLTLRQVFSIIEWPNTALEPTATAFAVSIMFGFIVCPFGCVSQARGRGSALIR